MKNLNLSLFASIFIVISMLFTACSKDEYTVPYDADGILTYQVLAVADLEQCRPGEYGSTNDYCNIYIEPDHDGWLMFRPNKDTYDGLCWGNPHGDIFWEYKTVAIKLEKGKKYHYFTQITPDEKFYFFRGSKARCRQVAKSLGWAHDTEYMCVLESLYDLPNTSRDPQYEGQLIPCWITEIQ